MGANVRIVENRTERRLRSEKTRGMGVAQPPRPKRLAELLEDAASRNGDGEVNDLRSLMPAEGLREYWYPALPAKKVPRGRKPLYWKMLGEDLALFRGKDGKVKAVSDVCPHRGASLSQGKCFFDGTITCPYHGATFDAEGACVAFLTEGPASEKSDMVVRTYPTETLRDWVWIWMGDGEPVPIQEDVPPEFFDESPSVVVMSTYTYWATNWLVAIENQGDSHNGGLFAHRNSLMQLTSKYFVRTRTVVGPRSRNVNDRALIQSFSKVFKNEEYVDEKGEVPFQLYYPGVEGYWPKTRWRQRLWKVLQPWYSLVTRSEWRRKRTQTHQSNEEWCGTPEGLWGHHMPCTVRINLAGYWLFSRFAVPVTANQSRVVYFHTRVIKNPISRMAFRLWYHGYLNWWYHYNFSSQDNAVAGPCRYWTPESLTSTDSQVVALRRHIARRSRDAQRAGRPAQDSPQDGQDLLTRPVVSSVR